MRGTGIWTDGAVVAVEAQSRESLESGTRPRLLGSMDEPLRLLIIETILIGVCKCLLDGDVGNLRVRHGIGELELLTDGKADRTCDSQLLLRVVVLDSHEALLARLHVHLRAENVYPCSNTVISKIDSLLVKGFCCCKLGLGIFHACLIREPLEIKIGHHENHKLASVLLAQSLRLQSFGSGAVIFEKMQIKSVGCCATGVENTEWPDDARGAGRRRESECRKVNLLFGPRSPSLHMGQHFAECAKAFGARGAAGDAAQHQSQVVAKSA